MNNEHLQQKPADERITDVEAHLAHLQKNNDELSNVIFEHQKRIAAMEKLIAHLQNRIGDIKFQQEEPRTLEDDRPPHY